MNNTLFSELLYLANNSRDLYSDTIASCATSCGITKPEADLLLFFGNNPQFNNACDAVHYRNFSKAYVSKAVSSLSKRNFLTITEDSKDRRYQKIQLNDHAKGTLEVLQKCQRNYFNSIRDNISDEELESFINVVQKISNNFSDKSIIK